jgi:hypothetical protein
VGYILDGPGHRSGEKTAAQSPWAIFKSLHSFLHREEHDSCEPLFHHLNSYYLTNCIA